MARGATPRFLGRAGLALLVHLRTREARRNSEAAVAIGFESKGSPMCRVDSQEGMPRQCGIGVPLRVCEAECLSSVCASQLLVQKAGPGRAVRQGGRSSDRVRLQVPSEKAQLKAHTAQQRSNGRERGVEVRTSPSKAGSDFPFFDVSFFLVVAFCRGEGGVLRREGVGGGG